MTNECATERSSWRAERLDDWIGEDNPVRAIDVFVDELDIAGLGFDGVEGGGRHRLRKETSIQQLQQRDREGCGAEAVRGETPPKYL